MIDELCIYWHTNIYRDSKRTYIYVPEINSTTHSYAINIQMPQAQIWSALFVGVLESSAIVHLATYSSTCSSSISRYMYMYYATKHSNFIFLYYRVYIYKFGEHIPPSPSQLVEEDHNSSRSINWISL